MHVFKELASRETHSWPQRDASWALIRSATQERVVSFGATLGGGCHFPYWVCATVSSYGNKYLSGMKSNTSSTPSQSTEQFLTSKHTYPATYRYRPTSPIYPPLTAATCVNFGPGWPFPVASHGMRSGRLVGGEFWGTRIPHSVAARLLEGRPAALRRTHAEPAARLRPWLPGDAPAHAPTARADAPPLCLVPPRGPEVRAPARWRLRGSSCGPCAACVGCCFSSPSSTSCRAGVS